MSNKVASTLVVAEHDRQHLKKASLSALDAAKRCGSPYALLCIGCEIEQVVSQAATYGAAVVYAADQASLLDPMADRYAQIIAKVFDQCGADTVIAASSTFTRDVLPRVAALIDAPMLSDIVQIKNGAGEQEFQRPINAGSEIATVTLRAERRVLSIRPGSFTALQPIDSKSPVEQVSLEPSHLIGGMRFIARDERQSSRPELSDAQVVVAGGRPIQDRETYERIIGKLADVLGGAVGATRALVDAEVVPNDWQIGQTGKALSPELYIAVGISGSIQHLAGVMDSRVIVAINKDPTAPMMKVATYAMTADLHEAVPRLIQSLQSE